MVQPAVPESTTEKIIDPVPEPPEALRLRAEPKVLDVEEVIVTAEAWVVAVSVTVVATEEAELKFPSAALSTLTKQVPAPVLVRLEVVASEHPAEPGSVTAKLTAPEPEPPDPTRSKVVPNVPYTESRRSTSWFADAK